MAFKKKKKLVWFQGEEKGRLTSGISFMGHSACLGTIYPAFYWNFFAKSVLKYTYILKKIWKSEKKW